MTVTRNNLIKKKFGFLENSKKIINKIKVRKKIVFFIKAKKYEIILVYLVPEKKNKKRIIMLIKSSTHSHEHAESKLPRLFTQKLRITKHRKNALNVK